MKVNSNVLDLSRSWGAVCQTTPSYSKEEVLAKRLKMASADGKVEEVKALLKANADVNWNGYPFNSTPLLSAALGGHLEVCKLLLEKRARTDIKDELLERTPLEAAQQRINMNLDDKDKETYKKIASLIQQAQKRAFKL